jgi:hypothetical protein
MTLSQNSAKIPYFYSNSHIWGCVFAMLGLILHYWLEPTTVQWYVAAALPYFIGSLGFRDKAAIISKPPVQPVPEKINLHAAINKIIVKNRRFLPDDAIDLLINIGQTVENILPKLESNSYRMIEAHTVRRIIEDYLPTTLACYIKLPAEYAITEPVEDKTAHQMLIDQLELLNDSLKEISQNLVDEDVKNLIINGRFLKEKFAPTDDGFNL